MSAASPANPSVTLQSKQCLEAGWKYQRNAKIIEIISIHPYHFRY